VLAITSSGRACTYKKSRDLLGWEIAMKKIMLTAAVAAALFFVLAGGMASVPTNSPSTYQPVYSASLQPVW
jgi:hypothetical protein